LASARPNENCFFTRGVWGRGGSPRKIKKKKTILLLVPHKTPTKMAIGTKQALDTLLREAGKSNMKSHHAAVIIKNGKVIAMGHNYTMGSLKKQHDRQSNEVLPLSMHAEESALRDCNAQDLNGAMMLVARWGVHDTNPTWMNSKPCDRCGASIRKMMKKHRLRRVRYSTGTGEKGMPLWEDF